MLSIVPGVALVAVPVGPDQFFTTTPPITTKPLMTSRLSVACGTRVLSSTPPISGVTRVTTVQSSGTLISMPPHRAKTSITASVPGSIDACRRSISQPPMTAVRSAPRKVCELLRRDTPPMIARPLNDECPSLLPRSRRCPPKPRHTM